MANKNTTKQKKGGGFLLLIVSVYFVLQFKDLDNLNDYLGMLASAVTFSIGLHALFNVYSKKL